MAWIFRDGDTKRAKQVTVAGLLVVLAGIHGGMIQRNFMPSDLTDALGLTLASASGLGALLALILDRNPHARFNHHGPLRRLLVAVIGALAFSLAAWLAFGWGMPSLITQVWGKPLQAEARVHAVFAQGHGRGCRHRFEISSPALPDLAQPCVSKEIWQQAKVGDAVRLHLFSGSLGVHISGIEQK